MSNSDTSNNNINITYNNFATISDSDCQKLTELENTIQKETGEKVALVAYHID